MKIRSAAENVDQESYPPRCFIHDIACFILFYGVGKQNDSVLSFLWTIIDSAIIPAPSAEMRAFRTCLAWTLAWEWLKKTSLGNYTGKGAWTRQIHSLSTAQNGIRQYPDSELNVWLTKHGPNNSWVPVSGISTSTHNLAGNALHQDIGSWIAHLLKFHTFKMLQARSRHGATGFCSKTKRDTQKLAINVPTPDLKLGIAGI